MIARLRDSRRGTAIVEFAMVLPVALTLYFGSIQLQDGLACNRKVTIATRAVADLVAQNVSGTLSASAVDGILGATTQILAPYPTSAATMRVTQVLTDANGVTRVQWSRARGGPALARNTVVTIPAQMRINGIYFLLAEVNYAYTPPVFLGNWAAINLKDNIYMLPRNTSRIDCNDC